MLQYCSMCQLGTESYCMQILHVNFSKVFAVSKPDLVVTSCQRCQHRPFYNNSCHGHKHQLHYICIVTEQRIGNQQVDGKTGVKGAWRCSNRLIRTPHQSMRSPRESHEGPHEPRIARQTHFLDRFDVIKFDLSMTITHKPPCGTGGNDGPTA